VPVRLNVRLKKVPMFLVLLTLSLLLVLVAVLLANSLLFAVAVVSSIVSLTAVRGVPRWPLLSFWLWVNLVLLYLVSEPNVDGVNLQLVMGIPVSAFWMLLGIWLVPIVLWPLAFFMSFRNWMSQ
jgi:hypothetical protein